MTEGIERRAEFTIEESDVISGTRAAMRAHMLRKPYLFIFLGAYLMVVLLLAALMGFRDLIPLAIAAVVAPPMAYLVMIKLAVPWQARRHFKQVAAFGRGTFAQWDESGIVLGNDKGQSRLEWSEFFAWERTPEVVMLFQAEALFNVLPISAIGEAGADDILGKLRAAGVKRR